MPAFDLLICDCDGVLVDSEIISHRVLFDALTRYVPAETLEPLLKDTFGLTVPVILEQIERGHWDSGDKCVLRLGPAADLGAVIVPGLKRKKMLYESDSYENGSPDAILQNARRPRTGLAFCRSEADQPSRRSVARRAVARAVS